MNNKKKRGISFIVPFYNGNKYIHKLIANINEVRMRIYIEIELIIINDSPSVAVELQSSNDLFCLRILNNEKNRGIHYSRVRGIKCAKYDWIQFLDQDDELISSEYESQLVDLDGYDLIIGNGINVGQNRKKILFRNQREMEFLMKEQFFIKSRNFIRSPGQCLVRREAIPEYWLNNILTHNGADDWFLWLLMFNDKANIKCNANIVYLHNQLNGDNLSANNEIMRDSCIEMNELLKKNDDYSNKKCKSILRTVEYRFLFLSNKCSIRNAIFLDKYIQNTFLLCKRKLI